MIPSSKSRRPARSAAVLCAASFVLLAAACGGDADPGATPQVADTAPATLNDAPRAIVRITEPSDGAQVAGSDVRVSLDVEHITIVPAGDTAPNSGHHHLLLNVPVPAEGEPIPADQEGFIHLGQAQTEYTFQNLPPGNHTVIAVIGDFAHRVVPQVTDTVRFTVLPRN